jgi:CDP-diglyceride synthetase
MLHHLENHIEKMRSKPSHIKTQYAFFVSLGITAIIFVFWINSFGVKMAAMADGAAVASPAQSLTAGVGDAFHYIKELFVGANKATYTSDNVEVVGKGKN